MGIVGMVTTQIAQCRIGVCGSYQASRKSYGYATEAKWETALGQYGGGWGWVANMRHKRSISPRLSLLSFEVSRLRRYIQAIG